MKTNKQKYEFIELIESTPIYSIFNPFQATYGQDNFEKLVNDHEYIKSIFSSWVGERTSSDIDFQSNKNLKQFKFEKLTIKNCLEIKYILLRKMKNV